MKKRKVKIAFVANTGWYFYNFRNDLIDYLSKRNYELYLICPKDKYAEILREKDINVIYWDLNRSSTNIFKELKSIYKLIRILRKINIDIIHNFTIKGVLYGTISSKLSNIKYTINSITGLGSLFIIRSLKDRIIFLFIFPLYKFIINKSNSKLIFQNKYDLNFFIRQNIISQAKTSLIRGSGINTNYFRKSNKIVKYPKGKKWKLLFPARVAKFKGIEELIIACNKLWIKNKNFRLYIAGEIDYSKASNDDKKYFKQISSLPYIAEVKYQKNMRDLYEETDIVILPSWREGLSRSLLEAGSMEIPIITTDVPGCKDIVINGETGLLVKRKNPKSILSALEVLMENEKLCKRLGKSVRKHIINNFDSKIINEKTFSLYEEVISK